MIETILVRGVAYPPGDHRRPTHPSKPGGPLVPIPGTVVPLSQGGDGGVRAAGTQQYIGHARVPIPPDEDGRVPLDPVNDLGDVYVQADYPMGDNGVRSPTIRPITYRWVYDSSPVLVRKTPEILRALARGEIVEVKREPRAKGKKEGE